MSHISLYETYERQNQVLQTPCPKDKGRRVRDFTPATFATPLPKAFLNRPTPSVRKVNAGTDLVAEIEEEENEEAIKRLQGRNWKIYSFSPFFNFSEESPKVLQTFLTTKLQNSEVKVEKVRGLRGTREDAECLKINVLSEIQGQSALIYFLAVHTLEFELNTPVTALPLALVLAPEKVTLNIFENVGKLFDCRFCPLKLEAEDLKWVSALWSGTPQGSDEDLDKTKDVAKFTFKLPKPLQGLGQDTVQVTLNGVDIRKIWNLVMPNRETEMTLVVMERFHELVNRCVLDSFGINTEYLTLIKVSLPAVSASSDGHVKISNFDKIKTILGFLTSLSQERCVLRADPRLGLPIG